MPAVDPTGFASTNEFGTAVVANEASDISALLPTGFSSTNAFGTLLVRTEMDLFPESAVSANDFGTARVARSTAYTNVVTNQQGTVEAMLAEDGISDDVEIVSAPLTGSSSVGTFTLTFKASPSVDPVIDFSSVTNTRALMTSFIDMPAPAVISGKPYVPAYWLKNDSAMTLTTGASHIRVMTPLKPTVGGPTDTEYTWTVEDLAEPPGNHGHYNLSTWKETDGGPSWKSTAPYRPSVQDLVVYGAEGAYHTYSNSVHFDANSIEHMWIDLGTHSQPFTWVFCGMINYYPYKTYGHYILDAGKATPVRDVDKDWKIDEGLSQRSLMLYQSSSCVLATHTGRDAVANGKHIRGKNDDIARPRVFIGVFNGANSWIGSYDKYNFYGRSGTIDNKSHRYFVMGRRTNNISDNLASHMTMFEIRFFDRALTKSQRQDQYRQLASKWHFNKYGKGT